MPLASRGLGPGRIVATNGLGPVWIVINATVSPGVIDVVVTLPSPNAFETFQTDIDLATIYVGRDAVVFEAADPAVRVSVRSGGHVAADYIYRTDQSGPPIGFRWLNYAGALYDFTVGTWTFTLHVVTYAGVVQKTVGNADITGGTGGQIDPNVTIDWPLNFFGDVPPDQYQLHLQADDEDSKPHFFSLHRLPTLQVIPAPTV